MIGKNNNYLRNVKTGTKVETYSIKKFKIGAASVVIGAGIFFGFGSIAANEVQAHDGETTIENVQADKNKEVENETITAENKVADAAVVELEKDANKVNNLAEKTESPVVADKAEKSDASVEEKEVPKTVGIPAENTEPTSNSIANSGSHDPRNGQPLTEGTAFRDAEASAEVIETEPAEAPKLDKAPLSADDQKNHFKKFQDEKTKLNKDLDMLNKQLFFIDWGDKDAVTNMGDEITHGSYTGREIKVGTIWEKEITPGYKVRVEVTKLENIVGEPNGVVIKPGSEKYEKIKKEGGNPDERYARRLMAYKENYNGYSAAYDYGLKTDGLIAVSGEIHLPGHNQGPGELINVGVTFKISATYKGRTVKPAFFAVSAEEASEKEAEIYKTNGKGWELLTELMNSNVSTSFISGDKGWIHNNLASDLYTGAGYDKEEKKDEIDKLANTMYNTKITTETVSVSHPNDDKIAVDGLGTQTFGPVANRKGRYSTPIIVTRGATEISAYLLSAGAQAFSFGVLALDEGDASSSYGEALHTISIGRDKDVHHPYIGKVKADIDEKDLESKVPSWKRDGVIGDTDEGPGQLMGNNVVKGANNEDYYTLHKVNEGTYELKIDAHRGDGNDKSYVRAWIDFNNNGKFDDDEASELVTVTQDGVQTLKFKNKYQNVDTTAETLGMRVRTALADHDISTPTGYAFSGEVEDFKIQQTLPPRGEKKQTIDLQGKKQSTKIEFNAYGKKDYDFDTKNEIDTTVAPKIFKTDGTEVKDSDLQDGYYVVPGEGEYKVTADGKDVNVEFIPEDGFVGKAKGIIIRRSDINKTDTGWGKIAERIIVGGEGKNGDIFNVNSAPTNTMDGYYVPIVTPKAIAGTPDTGKDLQKNPQKKTLIFKNQDGTEINSTGIKKVYSLKDVGTDGKLVVYKDVEKKEKAGEYSIDSSTGEVTFTPDPKFTGTAPEATVVLTITPANMDSDTSLTDDDKKALTKTAEATFTPTVVGAIPEGKNAETKDIQGQPQTAKIVLDTKEDPDATNTINFNKGSVTLKEGEEAKTVELDPDTLIMLDGDKAVASMDAKAGDKVVGTYKLDPVEKTITFTPNKDYDGKTPVTPATLRILDINGGEAKATYTPTVVPVTPTADPKETKDIQGAVQTGKPEFKAGSVEIDGAKKEVPLDDTVAAKLVNDKGEVLELNDKGEYVVEKVGTYKVAEDGTVIFTPEKTYVGKADGVYVRRVDKNGTAVDAKYIPTVVEIKPTATPAETENVQGEKQTAKIVLDTKEETDDKTTVNFDKGRTTEVTNEDGNPKSVDLDEKTLTMLDGAKEVTELDAKAGDKVVGKYTLDKEKKEITFTPNKDYDGSTPVTPATLRIADANGTTVTTTYTPKVTPVIITPKNDDSEKVQGLTQSGKPTFTSSSDKVTFTSYKLVDPKDNSPKDEVVIEGKGKYKIAEDGTVTFIPEPNYIGEAPIEVVATDSLGRPTKAMYTPKTTEITLTASDIESKDIQGNKQSGKPTFALPKEKDVEVKEGTKLVKYTSYKLVDPSDKVLKDEVKVKDIGTYIIAKDGTVTFVPEKAYKGEVPTSVDVKATAEVVNEEGKSSTLTKDAKYTPTVVPVTPTADNSATKGPQGAKQVSSIIYDNKDENTTTLNFYRGEADINGEIKFKDLDKVTVKLVSAGDNKVDANGNIVVPNEGTYSLEKDEKGNIIGVSFTPLKDFAKKATAVTVEISDINGSVAKATYTPEVTPVKLSHEDKTSTGLQGKTQTGTPVFTADDKDVTFTKYELVGADKDGKVVVENEGTYTIDPKSGKVTFVPVANYVTTKDKPAKGVVVRATSSTTLTEDATYRPEVTPLVVNKEDKTSKGVQGAKQVGTPTFTIKDEDKVNITEKVYSLEKADATGKVVVENEGTYTIDPKTGKVTFVPVANYVTAKDKPAKGVVVIQKATLSSDKVDKVETTSTIIETKANYVPEVTEVTAEGNKKETIGKQGMIQKGSPDFMISDDSHVKDAAGKLNVSYSLEKADATGKVVVEGVGTYTIDSATGEVTFAPEKSYVGKTTGVKVNATYVLTSDDKTTIKIFATGEYIPTVVGVELSHKDATSIDIQGKTQTGTPEFSADDKEVTFTKYELVGADKEGKVVIENEGTYTIDPKTGKVTFVPVANYVTTKDKPAKGIVVRATSSTTLTEDATYTPKVVGVTPTAHPSETTGVQGAKQTSKVIFDTKDEDKATLNFDKGSVVVNEGEDAKYVDLDASTLTLLDGDKEVSTLEVKDKEGKVVGTYTVDKEKGEVVFQPKLDFVGVAPSVDVQIKDKNGTIAKTTYTPTVTLLVLSHEDVVSEKVQGANQKGTPIFKEPTLPEGVTVKEKSYTFVDGTTTKEVENEGVYTINPQTGEVTFSPRGTVNKPFEGTAKAIEVKATYTFVSEDNTEVKISEVAKYTPTVLPLKVEGKTVISEELKGKVHNKDTESIFTVPKIPEKATIDSVEYSFEGGVTVKEVPNEGKYEIAKDGKVTFTPYEVHAEKLEGVKVIATYTVKSEDGFVFKVLGTGAYRPEVKVTTPTAESTTSEGPRRKSQSGTPIFTPGVAIVGEKEITVPIDDKVAPILVDEKGTAVELNKDGEYIVVGEGKYTISAEGVVTFTPEENFTGEAKGVYVKRIDELGTPAVAKYTPTVRPETIFVDKDNKHLIEDKDGAVEKENIKGYIFVETVKDKEGNIKHIYKQVVTNFVDKEGKAIPNYPTKDGEQPKENIKGYIYVETKVDEKGNIKHIYKQVVTNFVDKEGKAIPNYPTKDGEQPKENIKGYIFVETVKDKEGNIKHIYKQVVTNFVDKEGKAIPNYPTKDGEQPKENIKGYIYVETKVDEKGNIKHVYKQVVTNFVDKEDKAIPNYPTKDGEQPKENIKGYIFVETKVDEKGNVTHIYRKVETPIVDKHTSFVDENGKEIRPTEKGSQAPKEIADYELVKTEKDKDGNIIHVYRKVTTPTPINPLDDIHTEFVDEAGVPILPGRLGKHPEEGIKGYIFVETKVDKEGNIKHIYKQISNNPVEPSVILDEEKDVVVEKVSKEEKILPNTESANSDTEIAILTALGLLGIFGARAVARRKKD